jgi:hypothetical protein
MTYGILEDHWKPQKKISNNILRYGRFIKIFFFVVFDKGLKQIDIRDSAAAFIVIFLLIM